MDAYRKGFSGKAAEWVVKKQKNHRSVSEAARIAMDAILSNTAATYS
jgi:hypothetical protein